MRLKDFKRGYFGIYKGISIPFGAIKSVTSLVFSVKVVLFQFLLVRLKVTGISIERDNKIIFQFLLVRLKAC